MTDKELKKLSRLELLELLLTESRENERLKEEFEKVKQENTVEKSAQHLEATSKQIDEALQKMSSMITELGEVRDKEQIIVTQTVVSESATLVDDYKEKNDVPKTAESEKADQNVDFDIYKSLIVFFISNPEGLDILPEDLRRKVIDRIEEIKSK